MELLNLKAQPRVARGKGGARQTRRAGRVPAVLYGGDGGPLSLSIDGRAFLRVLHGELGEHAVVQLEIEGQPELNSPAIVKQVQHDPVYGHVLHADLFRIRLDQKIKTMVPIHLEGRAKGILEGGVLDHQLREIEVECPPLEVPKYIIVNIETLEIGHSLHVSDIVAPDNVVILTPSDRPVVAIHAPRVQAATPAEGEAAAAAPVEGEAKQEGEAPAEKSEKSSKG